MSLRVSVSGTPLAVVTLTEAKAWLSIDFADWDSLIQSLIDSSIDRSQKVSGTSFWPITVTVTGNQVKEYVYPIGPVTTLLTDPDDNDYKDYTYSAGYASGQVPADLKRAVLQRVATGFAERQNGQEAAINKATEPSLIIELAYRENLYL